MSRSTRKRRRNHARKGNNNLKNIALIAAPLAVMGAGAGLLLSMPSEEKMDAEFCYARADQHQSTLFIDNSVTALSPAQLRDYERALRGTYESAPANSRIMIFTTAADSNASLVEPVASICKPAATVAEQADLGAPDKPAPYIKRRSADAAKAYMGIIAETLQDVQDVSKAAGDSPILEQLRAISRYKGFQGQDRSLTVLTDGIQNSDIARFCSHKGHLPLFAKFTQRRDYTSRIQPKSWAGTDISIMLVGGYQLPSSNMPYCTNAEIERFWPAYFKANAADTVEINFLRAWGR